MRHDDTDTDEQGNGKSSPSGGAKAAREKKGKKPPYRNGSAEKRAQLKRMELVPFPVPMPEPAEPKDVAPKACPRFTTVDEINREYAVGQYGGKVVVVKTSGDKVEFLSVEGMGIWFANQKIQIGDGKEAPAWKYWMARSDRRQFERIVFRPGAEAGPRELNLWTGLGLEPEEPIGRFAHVRITAHIFNVICGGGKDHYKYMMNSLAHIVQKPAEKPGVAVVLKGKKGVGKDTLALLMARIVGKRHYTHIDKPDALVGRFNAQFERSIFVHVEEAFWSGDRAKKGVLQSMITSPTMEVERKGFDVITRDSFVRLMMTTNERWAIPASDDERRYFVLDVPETYRNDFDYFDGLYDEINGDAARGFLHTLKSIDLTGWNPRKVPQTNALLHQKLESLEGFDAWWFDMLSSATLPSVERKFDDRGRIYEQATKIDWETKKNAPPEGINVAKEWMRQSYAKFLRARKFEGDPIHDVEFGHKMSAAGSVPAKGQIDATDKRRPIYRVKSLDEARALFAARVGGDASMWVEHKDEEEKTREEEDASGFPAL